MNELPDDMLTLVMHHCDHVGLLNAREVSAPWSRAVDLAVRDTYEDDLCTMLSAMRITPHKLPRQWLYRYAAGRSCGTRWGGELCCHHNLISFPWLRTFAGPAIAACSLMFFAKFLKR